MDGSDESLCTPCPLDLLPRRANFIYVRGDFFFFFWAYFVKNAIAPLSPFYISHATIWHKGQIAGGVSQPFCPYKCISDKYRVPNCFTPLEELMYTFGGPWPFGLLMSVIIVLLALLLSTLRIKLIGSSSSYGTNSTEHHSHDHFPYLLSLSEVQFW